LAVPRLWRRVPIPGRHFKDRQTREEFLHFLRADYLNRSRKETLIFSLENQNQCHEARHRIYKTLSEDAERWGDVELYLRADPPRLRGRLHSMYSLDLVLYRQQWEPDESFNIFKEASRLRRVRAGGHICLPYDTSYIQTLQLDLLWPQVTHFYDTHKPIWLFDHRTLCEFKNLVYGADELLSINPRHWRVALGFSGM
jgi:hypothetical protein